ncbi:MAG: pectin acetylesterase-family hydrolase [Myxococcota bacterium]
MHTKQAKNAGSSGPKGRREVIALVCLIASGGWRCSSDAPPANMDAPESAPFQVLYDQGIDRYLGRFSPDTVESLDGGLTTYTFAEEERGPLCFTGSEFRMTTRDGSDEALMIFLQGGGACGESNCEAVETAMAGIPPFGVLSNSNPSNPAAQYNVGYLPYCDGTLWSGDRDVDSDDDGTEDRFFRGLQNLSASLDVIANRYPSPSMIFLTGNSAGGFGTHMALPLVRRLYPDVPIELINDSGVGISTPGTQLALNDYWNAGAFFPAGCDDCIGDDGHLTDYHQYQLAEDSNLRMGFMSTKQDAVINERLMIGGAAFEAALLESVAELSLAHPARFRSFIADGDGHTFILRDFERVVATISVRQWIGAMLDGGERWVSVAE